MEIIWLPLLLGGFLMAARPLRENRPAMTAYAAAALVLECGLAAFRALSPGFSVTLGWMAEDIEIALAMDGLSRLFLLLSPSATCGRTKMQAGSSAFTCSYSAAWPESPAPPIF